MLWFKFEELGFEWVKGLGLARECIMSMRSTHKTHKTVIYSTSKDMFGILILLWGRFVLMGAVCWSLHTEGVFRGRQV